VINFVDQTSDERCLDSVRCFRRQQTESSSARLVEHRKLSRGKKCFVPRCLAEHRDFLERNVSVSVFVAVYVCYVILCMRK